MYVCVNGNLYYNLHSIATALKPTAGKTKNESNFSYSFLYFNEIFQRQTTEKRLKWEWKNCAFFHVFKA